MRTLTVTLLVLAAVVLVVALSTVPSAAQERTVVPKAPTFAQGVEQATAAVATERYGAAVDALQAAIRDIQKMQRAAVVAGLPKPDGWQIEDTPEENNQGLGAGMANMVGMTIHRQYHKGDDKSIEVEIMANSPMVQMLGMMFSNPAMLGADGGEVIKYGQHKALLKKQGDGGLELQIVMYDLHSIKATSRGIVADDLLKIFNQAFIDRMEKPLGK